MEYKGYQPTIGIEVHAVMKTNTKLFCSCPVVNPVHEQPNTAICPVCTGVPGAMPVLNRKAVEQALLVSLALGCKINQTSIFARKSYFYPDLPKGYQISQYELPIAEHGIVKINTSQGVKEIGITRAHIEEDTGKLQHRTDENGNRFSLVDLNRSSAPLLEIVTEPDLHSIEEVRAYAEMLIKILRYTGVNDGQLELGMLRIEPNVSLAKFGQKKLGNRTEIKNLNSVRSLERAVAYELQRQYEILTTGGKIKQQTVGWNEAKQITIPQRSKEDAEDYRYFPEPDLPPLVIDDEWLNRTKNAIPELPFEKEQRFNTQYNLNQKITTWLIAEKERAQFFETVLQSSSSLKETTVASWMSNELNAILKTNNKTLQSIETKSFATLLNALQKTVITRKKAKEILQNHITNGVSIENALKQESKKETLSDTALNQLIETILHQHPQELEKYLAGNEGLFNWIFGQAMQASQGKSTPHKIKQSLQQALDKHTKN